ncbi:related to arylamine N-acetyltransferase [Cephalotrichum gorgonifer]|uniref:Related to arylamine N-acetyltransferase n=1 Tax=Cephalotrichum gorgonifer TaxID=2041049 RepID=A0AAE8SQH0_9PEZI|nr:related to arylamine N-acetyltransferase [Cephalotrichum gorgonifer]
MKPYTPSQVAQYLNHVSYSSQTPPAPTLENLHLLVTAHLTSAPFESLSLHYSPTRRFSVAPDTVFHKIVEGNGVGGKRGGYCMETNTVFGCILRSLGYDVLSVGGRVSFATMGQQGEGFSGWSHMANIITVDGVRYLVDVGFGANTPLAPLPFPNAPATALATGNRKLELKPLLSTSHPDTPPSWIYSHRASPAEPWVDAYALAREEFHTPDFEVMNLTTMTRSFFTESVICVRTFLAGEEWFLAEKSRVGGEEAAVETEVGKGKGSDMAGQLILFGKTLKYRTLATPTADPTLSGEEVPDTRSDFGPDVPLLTFETERARIEALRTYFGVVLSAEDEAGILGLPSALAPEAQS